jgi:ADP-heptose:LPS heptosyltransferase
VLKEIKKTSRFNNHKITLIGNLSWKDFAEKFDSDCVDRFIWIDVYKFEYNLFYHLKTLKMLSKIKAEILLAPTFSRHFYKDVIVSDSVRSREKIGIDGNINNISSLMRKITDKRFTSIIKTLENPTFEIYQTKTFFEAITGQDFPLNYHLHRIEKSNLFNSDRAYAVLFVGASEPYRKWSLNNFKEIAHYLKDEFKLDVVICGGKEDKENVDVIFNKTDFHNLTGRTSIVDMVSIVQYANIVISNETCIPHFAAASNVPAIVLYNGNNFGRFIPYPKDVAAHFDVVCHPAISENQEKYITLSNKRNYRSTLDINAISVSQVKEKIDTHFKNVQMNTENTEYVNC